jgi:O-antigen/teichoic acid export membrane protein
MLAAGRTGDVGRLYARSVKYVLLTVGPPVLVTIFFAGPLLEIWLGVEFAAKSTLVLQVLAIGMLFNSLAQMPAGLLDGVGRPDLRAKVFLLELPVYAGVLWLFLKRYGITGASLAWMLRALVEFVVFFAVSWKVISFKKRLFVENGLLKSGIGYSVAVVFGVLCSFIVSGKVLIQGIIAAASIVCFLVYVWIYALEDIERQSLLGWAVRVARLIR